MLAVNFLDILGWIVENIVNILLVISIIYGGYKTWKVNRQGFWDKLKSIAMVLIQEAEAMSDFKPGEGKLKLDYVVGKLLEEFSSKFSFISKKKIEKIVDAIVEELNKFSKLK